MKQINFKSLKVAVTVDTIESIDLAHEIGNRIHRSAETVPLFELASEIFHSTGDVCMSDELYAEMMDIIDRNFVCMIRQAVRESTTTIKGEEKQV